MFNTFTKVKVFFPYSFWILFTMKKSVYNISTFFIFCLIIMNEWWWWWISNYTKNEAKMLIIFWIFFLSNHAKPNGIILMKRFFFIALHHSWIWNFVSNFFIGWIIIIIMIENLYCKWFIYLSMSVNYFLFVCVSAVFFQFDFFS